MIYIVKLATTSSLSVAINLRCVGCVLGHLVAMIHIVPCVPLKVHIHKAKMRITKMIPALGAQANCGGIWGFGI